MPEANITGKQRKQRWKGGAAQAAILFFLLFLAGSAAVLTEWLYYTAGRQEYDRIAALYVETKPDTGPDSTSSPETDPISFPEPDSPSSLSPSMPTVTLGQPSNIPVPRNADPVSQSQITNIDFSALQAINPDCAAWIEIPGTRISYPVMYRVGDGAFYLTHTYGLTSSKAGAIHIDGASVGPDSPNLLIYGHTLLDGSMFTDLHRYKNQCFCLEHPYIYLHLPDGSVRQYQIAACVLTEGEQERFYLWDFQDDESAQAYYNQFIEESLYPTGTTVTATSGKQTLVLSTCTRRTYRRLIFAVEK